MKDFNVNIDDIDTQQIKTRNIFFKLVILSVSIFISIKYYNHNNQEKLVKTDLYKIYEEQNNDKNIIFNKNNVKSPYMPQGINECERYDPLNLFQIRFKSEPIYLCKSDISEHLCYINKGFLSIFKKGVTCQMKNFILNTSKWKAEQEEDLYIESINSNNLFFSKGLFSMKCEKQEKIENFNPKYGPYFNSWEYSKKSKDEQKKGEVIEELAAGKSLLFINRNKDSTNLFFSALSIMNTLLIIEHFNLNLENIQVVFFESNKINIDPLYDIYKNVISKGGDPIHVNQLKNKVYNIKEAYYVPINWDSPCFTLFPNIPNCNKSTKGYMYFNELINKYMKIPNFIEPTIYNEDIYYYPKNISNPNSPNYTTFLTVQWRRVWPKNRVNQERLLGNGIELVEKLYEVLPKSTLIRLVDTANLTITEQISLMKKTDYLLGVHGAGFLLSVFLPLTSIVNEINTEYKSKNLEILSKLSGHKTYIDNLSYEEENIEGNSYIYFSPKVISERVYKRMNETFYIKGFKHSFL